MSESAQPIEIAQPPCEVAGEAEAAQDVPLLPEELPALSGRGDDLASYGTARNWIGAHWCDASTGIVLDVDNPRHAKALGDVVMSDAADVAIAVAVAQGAQAAWHALRVVDRCSTLDRWARAIRRDREDLGWLVAHESGKTVQEALEEVDIGADWLTFTAAMAAAKQEQSCDLGQGVLAQIDVQPLGVVAGATPFVLPVLGPLWLAAQAISSGNTFILKPSESTPFSASRLAMLAHDAGLPAGVLNVIHGGRGAVDGLVEHPGVPAIALIGSSRTARAVYGRGAVLGKRMLCLGGAKNHVVVAPDADVETTSADIVQAAFRHGGQHCFATGVLVAVGALQRLTEAIVRRTQALKLGTDLGPMISAEARENTVALIDEAEQMGARVLVDGRVPAVDAPSEGYWLGPTVLDFIRPDMGVAHREAMGPVLAIVRADSLDAAIGLQRDCAYAQSAAIFTSSGGAARYAAERLHASFVGINVAAALPRPPMSPGGWGDSAFGAGELVGPGGEQFWTRRRKTMTRWAIPGGRGWVR